VSADALRPRAAGEPVAVALGCMNFGRRTPAAESERIIARALERGVTVFDTANLYTDGESEKIVGRALKAVRDRVQIHTKVGAGRVDGKPEGLSPGRIRAAVDESRRRLGVDRIDVYYFHMTDPATPLADSLGAMAGLQAAGVVGQLGVSNHAAWQILEMMTTPGAPRPVIAQVMYNLLVRQIETEYVGFARRHPIHTTVYNPLAGGLLTGRHAPGQPPRGSRFDRNRLYQDRYWSERFFALAGSLGEVAAAEGLSLLELSYAWLAGCPHVDSILVGPGSVAHLDDALDAVARPVSPAGRQRIDAIFRDYLGTDASYVR
jgi:aryl-alcohol dehydrogenase-like predicted oxidoreductase